MTPAAQAEHNALQRQLDAHRRATPRRGMWRFPAHQVEWAAGIVDRYLLDRVASWQDQERKGPGGVAGRVPMRALLVAMVLAAFEQLDYQIQTFTEILFVHIPPKWRMRLGIGKTPTIGDVRAWDSAYQSTRRRFHGLLKLVDPSPLPLNRCRTPEELEAATKDMSDELIAQRYDRLCWLINQIIEASLEALPEDYRRRWNGNVAVDDTPIPAYAKFNRYRYVEGPDGPDGKRVRVLRTHSADPTAGPYIRDTDHNDPASPDAVPGRRIKKRMWAHEAALAVMGPDGSHDPADGTFPFLVAAMAPVRKPGTEPGRNAITALASLAARGYPAGMAIGDLAYSLSKPENFAFPARALGYDLTLDYRDDRLGRQGEWGGALLIEGAYYCAAIPRKLISATIDLRAGHIDDAVYQQRIAARADFRLRPHGHPDDEGHIRMLCPAAGGSPTVKCELKPRSTRQTKTGRRRIDLNDQLRNHPPKICRQQTITVPPEAFDRFGQRLAYGSPEWRDAYSLLRNSIEGGNGSLKTPDGPAVGPAVNRRVRGVAAQSVFCALGIFSLNLARIASFLDRCIVGDDGVIRTKPKEQARRRRLTAALDDHKPTPPTGDPPPAA